MKKYYSKGNTITRIVAVNDSKKIYAYYEVKNNLELEAKLKEAQFEKVLMREVKDLGFECWRKDYKDATTYRVTAKEFVQRIIETNVNKQVTETDKEQLEQQFKVSRDLYYKAVNGRLVAQKELDIWQNVLRHYKYTETGASETIKIVEKEIKRLEYIIERYKNLEEAYENDLIDLQKTIQAIDLNLVAEKGGASNASDNIRN